MNEFVNSPWLFLPGFIVFWCAICFLLSRVSGWASLATYYASSTSPKGDRYKAQSLKMGYNNFLIANYGNIVTANLSKDALYLKVMPLFSLGHAKLCIPFADIEAEVGKVLFFKTVQIKFKKSERIRMHIIKGFGSDLLALTTTINNTPSS